MKVESKIAPAGGLSLAIFSVSWAAIFVRLCGAPPAVIAFQRLFFSCVILLPVFLFREVKSLDYSPGEWFAIVGAGFFLAMHFTAWISSLFFTFVASSLVILSAQPVFAAVISGVFLNEKIGITLIFAITLTITGALIIGYGDLITLEHGGFGDLLSLLGAFLAVLYLTIGRYIRQRHSLIGYIFPVYATAAIFMIPVVIISGNSFFDYPLYDYMYFILLAIVPTIIGHGMMNWSLKHFDNTTVNLSILGEPVIASVLAAFILNEIPGIQSYIGGALIFTGVYIGVTRGRSK